MNEEINATNTEQTTETQQKKPWEDNPEFAAFQRQRRVEASIQEMKKDDAQRALLELGMEEDIKQRPEILDSPVALELLINKYIAKASTPPPEKKETQQTQQASNTPPLTPDYSQSNQSQGDEFDFERASVADIKAKYGCTEAQAIQWKVFPPQKGKIVFN